MDEAAQTTEPALMCALAAAKARQVVFIGDTKQLPPTVSTQDAELQKTLGVSPMERLLKNGIDEFILHEHEQYRVPKSLRECDQFFFTLSISVFLTFSVPFCPLTVPPQQIFLQ